MAKILILFAHPRLQSSATHAVLIRGLEKLHHVTFHDLYEYYPDFDIDVPHEQELLKQHDVVLMQHPFYWYSAPPILKQWIDLVLEHGWAYGRHGKALAGKKIMNVISTGGRQEAYEKDGFNRFTIREFLSPFEQTAKLCRMEYLPPFVVHGTHLAAEADTEKARQMYHLLLNAFKDDAIAYESVSELNYMNEFLMKMPQA